MDKKASGLLMLALGVLLILWWYHLARLNRETVFTRLTEGKL